jgi:hypothetical protein
MAGLTTGAAPAPSTRRARRTPAACRRGRWDRRAGRRARRAPARGRCASARARRRRLALVGRPEDRHHGRAERARHVHRPGVVRDQQLEAREHAHELREPRLAGQHPRRMPHGRGDLLRERPLGGRAQHRHPGPRLPRQRVPHGREARGRPALGGAVRGARVEADPGPRPEEAAGGLRPLRGRAQRRVGFRGDAQSEGGDHRAIVVHLAAAPNRRGHPRAAGQEESAALRGVAPALRNSGEAERQRGAERVGEQHAPVESAAHDVRVRAGRRGEPGAVHLGDGAVQLGDRRAGEHLQTGARVVPREVAQRRQREHDVAQPIGRTHQEAFGPAHAVSDGGRVFQRRCIHSHCSGCARTQPSMTSATRCVSAAMSAVRSPEGVQRMGGSYDSR